MSRLDLEALVALEVEVWSALVRGDATADERLLSDDFLGVYPTGFAVRADHVEQLHAGPTVSTFALSEERMMELSESIVMLSYRADYRRVTAPATSEPESMYISSLWCERDGAWVNVFSQDTPTSDIAVP